MVVTWRGGEGVGKIGGEYRAAGGVGNRLNRQASGRTNGAVIMMSESDNRIMVKASKRRNRHHQCEMNSANQRRRAAKMSAKTSWWRGEKTLHQRGSLLARLRVRGARGGGTRHRRLRVLNQAGTAAAQIMA